jgi:hypothetical protein
MELDQKAQGLPFGSLHHFAPTLAIARLPDKRHCSP